MPVVPPFDVAALNDTDCPIVGFVGENTKPAVGGVPPTPMGTDRLAVEDRPRSLTTVRLTLNDPSVR